MRFMKHGQWISGVGAILLAILAGVPASAAAADDKDHTR